MDQYLVFGNPIAQSKSPLIHSMFAQQTGQELQYARMLAVKEDFIEHLETFFSNPLAQGCNITAPFKELAAQWVDELSSGAQLAGAINTIKRQPNGRFFGETTDGPGLVQDLLRLGIALKNKRILLLGAGGAARGVLKPLLSEEPSLLLVANRTAEKAQVLASLLPSEILEGCGFDALTSYTQPFDLIINSTSASLSGDLPAIADSVIAASDCVYDMSYSDKPTVFMQHASLLGVENVYDGLGMLVGQAAESFILWRGVRPLVEPVIQSLRANL
ncbi:shikimate dehydrogenase [Paraglaciecola hydrolytica]|uniref:Shikimate dehydrogenase (NADP(+)) n=1 Tax=Paraglaciecola hydrolytica TaxID=1799789 RepID=A0A136A435_9ALTE|nr:shikimate dehydrogenase [Paraglaciecola hydrolytica]KXI30005.1 shikimate dehydrogenase [Paraglaciecola hydrolytica]